ncbi:serine/threonine protein kinase [Hyphomonas sp. WL0036]|uniref:serine/threonine protein kinase n=1 Tax=Hyphomonas sediminis TaxID=2866160 RepID=UPI001C812784|nr:serine/threonine-protein kinase [Hyphomonas sediminis]MBY9068125.1 serine/threonine protein kinase [Hyphomonas sediminis]
MSQNLTDIQALFDRVIATAPHQRLSTLSRLTKDADIRDKILRLVDAAERTGAFMPTGAIARHSFKPQLNTNDVVGEWKVTGFFGFGGMGEVYSVERRTDAFIQKAALKIVSPEASEQQRFLTERAILARLEHPNISRIIDGGTNPKVGAYMVMELVEGSDFLSATHDMPERERLKLLLDLCAAVSHAHARLVLHRDIKPSNILIDEDGRLRLIDFGVGFEIDGNAESSIAPMTSDYAAPEQKEGRAVTVATDIFALGVVLRELLSGHRQPRHDARLSQDAAAIIAKATASEPSARYASVTAFAEDVSGYIAGKAIAARNGGDAYRASKFIRRHWLTSATSALFVLSLIGGLLLTSLWADRAEKAAALAERALAEREFEARTLSGYRHALQALYGIPEIDNLELDHALARIAHNASDGIQNGEPEDIFLVYAIGQNFMYRDDHAFAAEVLTPFADDNVGHTEVILDAKSNLARALSESGRPEEAAALVGQIRLIREASGRTAPADIAQELMIVANWTGELADYQAVIENAKRAISLAEPTEKVGYYYNQIGTAYLAIGEWNSAVDAMAKSFEEGRNQGIRTPDDITSAENLALLTIFLKGDSTAPLAYLPEYAEAADLRFQSPQKASFLYGLIAECALMNDQPELALSASENALRLIGNDYSYRSGWPVDLLSIQSRAFARTGNTLEANDRLREARELTQKEEIISILADDMRRADLNIRLDFAEAELFALSGQADIAKSLMQEAQQSWAKGSGMDALTPGIQTLLRETERVISAPAGKQAAPISEP